MWTVSSALQELVPARFLAVQVYTPECSGPAFRTTREYSGSSYTNVKWLLSDRSTSSCSRSINAAPGHTENAADKMQTKHRRTLYHRISGSGFPSTTTARRHVSPTWMSTSSMMVSNLGDTVKDEKKHVVAENRHMRS